MTANGLSLWALSFNKLVSSTMSSGPVRIGPSASKRHCDDVIWAVLAARMAALAGFRVAFQPF